MNQVYSFLNGGVFLSCFAAGLFFLRFWTKTREKLFRTFAFAFITLAIERMCILALAIGNDISPEDHSFVYLIRLVAFVMILVAVVDKNRAERRES